jgi:hypothetical protein
MPDKKNAPQIVEVQDAGTGDGQMRVMSLGTDSAGGYAVPFQLDGTKDDDQKKGHKK